MKKIKITKLEKPLEYKERELNDVKSMRKKLLQESNWTQIFDSGLTTIEILAWRIWRLYVRTINVTIENYLERKEELLVLSNNSPANHSFTSTISEYPLQIFKSIDSDDIVNTLIELLIVLKFDRKEAELLYSLKDKSITNILQLMDEILNGYRY